jgi:capsular exopolysaccharide synthesis family protein
MHETRDYKYNYQQEEENLFQEVVRKYSPYWPLFLILLFVGGVGAFIYLRYAKPVYEAAATILIKDEKKGVDESKILESLDLFGQKKIVENEIEIIKSRALAKEVARNLYLYAPILVEGRLQNRSAYEISPVLIEVQNPESIKEVKGEVPKHYFKWDSTTSSVVMGQKTYAINAWHRTPLGLLRFLPNPNMVPDRNKDGVNEYYFSLYPMKIAARGILNQLDAKASSKQSSIIYLSFHDEEPRRAENVLNNLITEYNKAAIADKNVLAKNTLQFVEDRLTYVVSELDSVERVLQQYKTRNNIIDISSQGKMFLDNVGENDQKMAEMNVQLAVLDQVENYVNSNSSKAGIVPSTLGVSDPLLAQLLERLYEAETQYDKLKGTTAENNPVILALQEQISKVRPGILENIRNQRKSLVAGRNEISRTNNKFASVLSTIPAKERELLEISRQQVIKNNIYTFLLQKREETALSHASAVADSRVIDKAEALGQVSPNNKLVYIIAIILSLSLCIAYIAIKEALNRTVAIRSEIERFTATPILGEVAKDNTKNPVVITEGKRTLIAEQFRHLRTSLGYLGINSRKKKILITSTMSGEGKSFVAANLGVSLALMGKKVLLMELDLRKPKLSEIMKVKSDKTGISGYLIGEQEPEEIIKATDINANLFIAPSGPIPPNPSELITNGKLQELFTYLETIFDYIVVDTAPVLPVTDAYILSPMCDATLYVVRQGHTPKVHIRKFDEQSKINPLKNVAIIFNGVQESGFGYGYTYGYAYEKEANADAKRKSTVSGS